jgi:hypothetical protein
MHVSSSYGDGRWTGSVELHGIAFMRVSGMKRHDLDELPWKLEKVANDVLQFVRIVVLKTS